MSHIVTPIFNGENYGFWRIKMKTIFQTKKLWEIVEGGVPNPPAQGDHSPEAVQQKIRCDEASLKDLTALQILQTAVSDSIFPRIAPASNAREAWNALKSEFEGSQQVKMIKLQSLRREYENLKMNDSDSINTFTTKLIEVGNQLRLHGEEKPDYQMVQKILISLPEKFDSIVGVLEQTKDLTVLSVTELIGTLKAHEKRISVREEQSREGAFYGEKNVKTSIKRRLRSGVPFANETITMKVIVGRRRTKVFLHSK
ncbi:hypothetical protein V5N11_005051 [Cardamine amara subsp. amara]|uniref:DUF4219 domain-containing protein n=1 Tax=Cardamine amara subsp. amara TaxID=228776 RepID=A0ABD0ZU19_CARAN